jgi:hypothetical protein
MTAMSKLSAFPQSPLARHPGLLLRKFASRLGWYRDDAPGPSPGPVRALYPRHWTRSLRAWLQHVPLQLPPHPFNRVFGQDFDEALLLRLCREGPERGVQGLTGDIKLIWDYSRGHALFTNAAADPAQVSACGRFLQRWVATNSDTNGPAWSCAMDTAIRAVNWILADAMFDGALGETLGRLDFDRWVWRHGHSIWRRLEARLVSSNHYLANLLGLVVAGSVFPQDAMAGRWLSFARQEFPRALLAQTRSDGGLNEASLRYHAFVTEMALLYRLVLGTPWPTAAENRLREMCQIAADFKDATGDLFPFGDDDSGRVLGVDFVSPMGRAEILLRLAKAVTGLDFNASSGTERLDSGWWIRRPGDFTVALDFGGAGLHGSGSHAHNDDFSICLEWRNRPVIVDSGTYLYTSDPEARNRFRSTRAHNTLIIDGREQRPLTASLFAMPGQDTAFHAMPREDGVWAFTRLAVPGVTHRREVRAGTAKVCVCDKVEGSGRRGLEWRFHLHPSVEVKLGSAGFHLVVPGAGALLLEASGGALTLRVEDSEHSPAYAQRHPARVCVAEGHLRCPVAVTWTLRPTN